MNQSAGALLHTARLLAVAVALIPSPTTAQPAPRVERNVVYGMYSGLALLMDAYSPPKQNGYGIVFINGSAYYAPLSYDPYFTMAGRRIGGPLKDLPAGQPYINALLEAGYTVFSINHRDPPRFRYPAAVEDAQRAVRYVRHHARDFGIRPDRIGAAGGSSGGHLVSLLGVLDGKGDMEDPDEVGRESAKVQCVVARAAPADLNEMAAMGHQLGDLMGMRSQLPVGMLPPTSIEYKTYREASPISHISKDSSPFLLIHGDQDKVVPFKNSEVMEQALKEAGVPVKLMRIEGADHGATFPGANNPPDYLGEMVRWFNMHLKKN
jgi:acetyl esterase/lipase